jgi:hypothetical protein
MKAANIWPAAGAVILVVVLGYFGFQAADGTGLTDKRGVAIVIGKDHRDAAKTYRTENVGGQTRVIPQYTPEMHILKLRIGDLETSHAVPRELFQSVGNGEQLAVTYQQRRISGGLQVTAVQRSGK